MSTEFTRVGKREARYTPLGTPTEHCGLCAHYVKPHKCTKVIGRILTGAWCKFFTSEQDTRR